MDQFFTLYIWLSSKRIRELSHSINIAKQVLEETQIKFSLISVWGKFFLTNIKIQGYLGESVG